MKSVYMELKRSQREEGWQHREQKRREEQELKDRERKDQKALEEEFRRWKVEKEHLRTTHQTSQKEEEDWLRAMQETDQKEEEKRREEEKRKKTVIEPSYEKLQAEVKKYDDGLVLGYKEDIDTLLVFAGLFSAVVTAFLIESYQWLSEDTTVMILAQISQQLNGTQAQSTSFTPEASSIRINCFWFLSLIFSLTSALFGLLCKQWLREHQRDVPTRTPGEDLALRQLRRDSFEKWGVASFLSALPILLEIALILFFVGVLDLLWTLHHIPFGICLGAIALSVGGYFLTTILPTIRIPRDQTSFIKEKEFGQLAYQFICPYKSPQAWAVYKLSTMAIKAFLNFPFANKFISTHLRPLWDHAYAQLPSWSTFDLRVVRQFDQEVWVEYPAFQLQVYELRALQWAVTMFRDSPSMIPHLENVLGTLPFSVATSAVLDRWDVTMWEVSRNEDTGTYLRNPNYNQYWPRPITSDPPLYHREGIELLFWHRFWNVCADNNQISILEHHITRSIPSLSKNTRFCIPLPLATALWSDKDPSVRQRSLRLLQHFEESWKACPGYDEKRHNMERVAFANALAKHIYDSDQPLILLTSKRGQGFIRFIHNEIIIRRLYSHRMFARERDWGWGWGWESAIEKVQEVGKLPPSYFAPLPARDENPSSSTQVPSLEPIRYSGDTVRPQGHVTITVNGSPTWSESEATPLVMLSKIGTGNMGHTDSVIDYSNNTSPMSGVLENSRSWARMSQTSDEGCPLLPGEHTGFDVQRQSVSSSGRSTSNWIHEDHAGSGSMPTLSDDNRQPLSPSNSSGFQSISKEMVPSEIDRDVHELQATQNASEDLPLLEHELGDTDGDEGRSMIETGNNPKDYARPRSTRRNISLAILVPPNNRHRRVDASPSGYPTIQVEQDVGGNRITDRVGWCPTNDPNTLRVQWFHP
ncbi:hypothetical protein VNI00_004911 [Paramarasmius palmivorus]|uniref:DUF6535 domain-containing protein n=1 Tax=Paramarasmius palmivorus TaxID=297713 RepID=A0AAW0DF52_9AGAR